jgi:hypothetical protein
MYDLSIYPSLGFVGAAGFLLKTAIGFGLVYLAGVFRRPNIRSNAEAPDLTAGTASTRGSHVPLLLGRRLVSPVVCWVGNPEAEPQYEEVTTKSRKKKKIIVGYKYYEDAMHVLCVGPGRKLFTIYERGEVIFSETITSDDTPSGTSKVCTDGSEFVVYWGELDQPIAPGLVRFLSVQSAFRGVFYIHWKRKAKGGSRQWPELKYDITGVGPGCEGTPLGVSDEITEGGYAGWNVAQVVWMLLTGKSPYGNAIPASQVDATSLNAWASDAATEAIPCNILYGDAATTGGALETIARDMGVLYNQVGARLAFRPLRQSATTLNIDDDRLRGRPRPRVAHDDRKVTRRLYTFPDIDHRFQRNMTEVSYGSEAARGFGYVDSEDQLDTVTDATAAAKIATIRATYENTATARIAFSGYRDCENLQPGDVVDLPTTGRCRVTEVEVDLETGEVEIVANPGLMTNLLVNATSPGTGTQSAQRDVEADPRVMVIDAPDQNDGDPAIVVLRLRAHNQIGLTSVHLSADSGTYITLLGNLPETSGGDLDTGESIPTQPDAWAAATPYALNDIVVPTTPRVSKGLQARVTTAGISGASEPTWSTTDGGTVTDNAVTWTMEDLADGPVYRPVSPDYNRVQNLSGDNTAWSNEAQYAIFTDGLLVSLQRQEAVAVSDRANSTPYALGNERIPAGVSTGLVYVVTTDGTSAASEPDASLWRVNEGETVTDGSVTWTARYPRYRLKGIRWTGETRTVGNLTADTGVYIASAERFDTLTDARIADGASVCIKTQPEANGDVIDLSSVTATCVTASAT